MLLMSFSADAIALRAYFRLILEASARALVKRELPNAEFNNTSRNVFIHQLYPCLADFKRDRTITTKNLLELGAHLSKIDLSERAFAQRRGNSILRRPARSCHPQSGALRTISMFVSLHELTIINL